MTASPPVKPPDEDDGRISAYLALVAWALAEDARPVVPSPARRGPEPDDLIPRAACPDCQKEAAVRNTLNHLRKDPGAQGRHPL